MNKHTNTRWMGEAAEAWLPYEPSPADAWDLTKVLRLHRRAGFGATWQQAQRDVADGFEPSIARVIAGAPTAPNGRPAALADAFCNALLESARTGGGELDGLAQAWLHCMVTSAWPLRERMLLAWHTHYATSNEKVRSKPVIARQAVTQRKLWRAPISQLHLAMLRDEAMLYWLDGSKNRRGTPNENLARELLELFSLGIGNYSEQDVRESARALTGWQRIVERNQELKYHEVLHDAGEKTIFGQTGPWKDEDLVRLILSQPAAAQRIAWRLWRTFISDVDEPAPELLEGLAASMRTEGDVNVERGLETLFRSRLFHADCYAGRRVQSPTEWVAMVVRVSELVPPRPDLFEVVNLLPKMGQRLFYPPNVAGWPGGKQWLTGPALVARENFAAWLTSDESKVPADHWIQLAERHGFAGDSAAAGFAMLFWGRTPTSEEQSWLATKQAAGDSADLKSLVRACLGVGSAHLA